MAEAAAAALLSCPAAPAGWCRQQCRRPAHASTRGARCRASPREQATAPASSSSTPLDVLRNDFSFLEESTGLDLLAPLEAVVGTHDEVVAVLNPIAGEHMTRALEEQIAGMQAELAAAHVAIHRSEGRLSDTVQNLSELEASVQRAFGASGASSSSTAAAAAVVGPATPEAAPQQKQQQVVQQQQRRAPATQRPAAPVQRSGRRSGSGLASSLAIPELLKDYWFPAEFSASLTEGKMVPFELFNETWVLFRDENGAAACLKDECAHRACPLSLGSVVDGRISCSYHGWQFKGDGECTKMPSTTFCKGVRTEALPVMEADGLVWVWPGGSEALAASPAPPPLARPPPGYQVHAELVLEVPVEHGLLLENLLDLAHAPFTHTSTFAKGWPVPDAVRFNAAQLLGGNWEPYPIDMQFGPPCMVLSTIGIASPGKIERGARAASCKNHLHQLHVCLPSSEGRTRLLYRMSMDFMHWTRMLPGIDRFWQSIAVQVLGEDLVLVQGQQDRMTRGADVWRNPVPYDKLGVRYRRWRNSVAAGDPSARQQAEAGFRQMSAGDLFASTDDDDEEEEQ